MNQARLQAKTYTVFAPLHNGGNLQYSQRVHRYDSQRQAELCLLYHICNRAFGVGLVML